MPKVHLAQVANLPLTEHTPTFPHPEFGVKQKSRRIQRTRATTILRISLHVNSTAFRMKQASGIILAPPTHSAVRLRTSQKAMRSERRVRASNKRATSKRTRVSSECVERSREKGSQALGRDDGDRRRLPNAYHVSPIRPPLSADGSRRRPTTQDT